MIHIKATVLDDMLHLIKQARDKMTKAGMLRERDALNNIIDQLMEMVDESD